MSEQRSATDCDAHDVDCFSLPLKRTPLPDHYHRADFLDALCGVTMRRRRSLLLTHHSSIAGISA
jgi:hypothetical protein